MLRKLAQRATDYAHRNNSRRMLKVAWFLRDLASWLRGGDWQSKAIEADRKARQEKPREYVILEFPADRA